MVSVTKAKEIVDRRIKEEEFLRKNGVTSVAVVIAPDHYLFSLETNDGSRLSSYLAVEKNSGKVDYMDRLDFALDHPNEKFECLSLK